VHPSGDMTISEAYRSWHYTLRQIADNFGLSIATVSQVVRAKRVAYGGTSTRLLKTRNPA